MVRTFRTHHVFSEEEREQVVRAYLNSGDTIGETAKRYGVGERSLYHWLKKHRQGVRRVEKALFLQEKKQEQKPAEMKPQTPEEELVYLRKELDKAHQELTEAKRAFACELFGKTKQAYYKNKTDGEGRLRREELIIDTVKQVREIAPGTGARKLWLIIKHIHRNEQTPGRDRFFGMLDARGLQLPRPKPRRTTNSNHRFRKHKNLIRGFVPQAANQLWSADITYIDTETGVCYLHVITDCYSHEILGWCIADTLEAKYTLEALQMAVRNCGQSDLTGLIHHSDRGCQYCCNEYTAYLNSLGARISMTEDYKPTDNAVAERINGIIKSELLYPAKRPKNRMEASRAIEGFIHYYNSLRPHMSIGNQTPDVARQQTGPQQRLWKNYYEKTCTCRKKDVTLHPVSINRVCPDGADASTPSGQGQLPTEVDNNVRK